MAKKRTNKDCIHFASPSCDGVTGSWHIVHWNGRVILLDCGIAQHSDYLVSYNLNNQKFPFDVDKVDYIFILHSHQDHESLVGRMMKEGFNGKIISSDITAHVSEPMLKNCSFLVKEEAKILSKRYDRNYPPIFEEEHIYEAFDNWYMFDKYNHEYTLDENVSFKFYKNSHCIGSVTMSLILKSEGKQKKIYYTSDIGGLQTNNHYVEKTEIPEDFHDICLMESTYGLGDRPVRKTREKDLEHLKCAIDTVMERGGKVVMPAFSFSRTQELLTNIYKLFHEDKEFKYEVVIDSMLSSEICQVYSKVLKDENKKLWNKVMAWENLRIIKDKDESRACVKDPTPKIIISASGFATNGRILGYLTQCLPDEKNMVIFSGYAGADPSYLSYRIQHYKEFPIIKINKEQIKNRADVVTLQTFSSHANLKDLITFGSSLNTNKLVLVHGEENAKLNLKKELEQEISKKDKSFRVVASTKDMTVNL